MRGLILGALIVFVMSVTASAQKNDSLFYFYDQSNLLDFKSVDRTMVPTNYFGEDIGIKLYMLQRMYTFVIKGTASSPGDKVQVEKPMLYNNIKKMVRYYKAMAKKGILTETEAKAKLDHVLNVGLSVKSQDTGKLEDALKLAKKPDAVAKVFERVVLN
jgi:hypothetical protein